MVYLCHVNNKYNDYDIIIIFRFQEEHCQLGSQD